MIVLNQGLCQFTIFQVKNPSRKRSGERPVSPDSLGVGGWGLGFFFLSFFHFFFYVPVFLLNTYIDFENLCFLPCLWCNDSKGQFFFSK